MGRSLLEDLGIATGVITVDADTAAVTGDYVSMKGYNRLLILIQVAAWPADTAAVTVEQSTVVAGSDSKELAFTKSYSKTGLVDALWTAATVTSNTFNIASNVDNELYAIEILASDLDVANGFDCVTIKVADPGTASSMFGVTYILSEPRYSGAGAFLTDPIVN